MKTALLPAASVALKRLQGWFSRAASRPLASPDFRSLSAREAGLRRAAGTRVRAANGMDGFDRLEIYHRQYWVRLVSCMQEEYPCAVHALGLKNFNAWAMRYLAAHPASSPYLADLDRGFPGFLARRHRARPRAAALEAARYDRAFSRAFDAPEGKRLGSGFPESARIVLAPHATPLWLHHDWKAYRALCREDESLEKKIPLRPREYGAVIYRHGHAVYEKEIPRGAYLLLKNLDRSRALPRLFAKLEKSLPARTMRELEKHLPEWFRDWTKWGWISSADS